MEASLRQEYLWFTEKAAYALLEKHRVLKRPQKNEWYQKAIKQLDEVIDLAYEMSELCLQALYGLKTQAIGYTVLLVEVKKRLIKDCQPLTEEQKRLYHLL